MSYREEARRVAKRTFNKLRYNTYNYNTGIEIQKDIDEERKIFFQKKHIDASTNNVIRIVNRI